MVELGSGAQRKIEDLILTHYACYLIVQNGDSRKEQNAFPLAMQKPTLLLVAPMAVQTNSRIGMVRRNLDSAHKQRRKVSLIEAIKAIKLRAICSKLRLQVALNC